MNEVTPQAVAAALWAAWLLYWMVTARKVKATRWRESRMSQMAHGLPLILAAFLLGGRRYLPSTLTVRFLPPGSATEILGLAVLVAGLGFSVWARRYLGPNWSGIVTLKEGHALVRTGPYKYVRHPIYSGLLLGIFGTAVTLGEWRGVLALGLVLGAFIYKSRVEEKTMREAFPEYEAYRRETAALIPFVF